MNILWTNSICMLAGLWLWISPFILGFSLGSHASANASVVGIFIGTFAMMAVATPQLWEEWAKVVLAVWLLISPWLLGFSHQSAATADILIVGVVVVVLSLWSMAGRTKPPVTT
jgi:SPW repeat